MCIALYDNSIMEATFDPKCVCLLVIYSVMMIISKNQARIKELYQTVDNIILKPLSVKCCKQRALCVSVRHKHTHTRTLSPSLTLSHTQT